MQRLISLCLTALCAALLPAAQGQAQTGIALEIRGGINIPVSDFADESGLEAQSEAGFAADLFVPVHPRFSVYAGAGREMFQCSACEGDDELLSTGLEAGAKFLLPVGGTRLLPWVKAGLIYHKADFTIQGIEAESDWGLGFQAGAGADVPLGEVLSFSPAIRYQTYTAEFEPLDLDFLQLEQDVSFLSVELGLHIHLRRP